MVRMAVKMSTKKQKMSSGPVKREVRKPDIREVARANGAIVEAFRNPRGEVPEGMEMAAFMAIFHPNIKGKKLKKLLG